ncbi:Flavoprotein desaturase PigA [Pandoraea terrae]|uniref:Flavoprotein desaturase PigA n=1 Tax=Pandoraea terrae TaxID=1537710 RepID=A0A5E4YVR7_9BURK|nr:acyl-CoA dehydrogenase family protein [Pandoraea terrae]VVE52415.1 Flavoprotein desaturase PigA [Pandoraea terrae]
MDFTLTDDQRAFADTAQSLFADFCDDDRLRAHDASEAPFMQDLWTQCVATGLHSMIVPEASGGLGLDMTALSAVLEQQGQALALVPLWEQQLTLAAIARFGMPSQQARWLDAGLTGETLLTTSLGGLVSPADLLDASEDGDGLRLNGHVAAVPLAAQSGAALLVAQMNGVPRLVLLDLAAPGVTRVAGRSQCHQAVADIHCDGVRVGHDAWLADDALRWFEPRAIACLAALQAGVSARQLARTVEYVSERRQFDRVIGSFQLVAGQMADCHIALEALRASLAQLLYRLDAGLGALPQAWATRVLACETSHLVGHKAQHVHGGIGVDVTYPIHRFLFWSRALGLALGGPEYNLAKLGDWLANHDSLGWKYDLAEDQTV